MTTKDIVRDGLKRGLSNKMIAREAGRAEGTVRCHVRDIMRELRVPNRVQAALQMLRAEYEMRP